MYITLKLRTISLHGRSGDDPFVGTAAIDYDLCGGGRQLRRAGGVCQDRHAISRSLIAGLKRQSVRVSLACRIAPVEQAVDNILLCCSSPVNGG